MFHAVRYCWRQLWNTPLLWGCSCGFSESWLWSDFCASFPFLWFFCRDSAQNPLLSLFYFTSLCLFKQFSKILTTQLLFPRLFLIPANTRLHKSTYKARNCVGYFNHQLIKTFGWRNAGRERIILAPSQKEQLPWLRSALRVRSHCLDSKETERGERWCQTDWLSLFFIFIQLKNL